MNLTYPKYIILSIIFLFTNALASQESMPRPEHPKPQFKRAKWMNLNGQWDFKIDYGNSGLEQNWQIQTNQFDQKILVPFPPESKLSGIEIKDFMPAVWYHRTFSLPSNWEEDRIFINFGAADYDCQVWINDQHVGRHYGGSSSFSFEITDVLKSGENKLVVQVADDIRSKQQPAGKQSSTFYNSGCCKYTRVTGIWQTVWLEAKPQTFLEQVKVTPDLDNSRFSVQPIIKSGKRGQIFRATLMDEQGTTIQSDQIIASNDATLILVLDEPEIWSPENPYLYGLKLELLEGEKVIDRVESYAGLRKFHIEGH